MISIALYEDNIKDAERVIDALNEWACNREKPISVKHYYAAGDVSSLAAFDCIMLDVKMPGINGIDFAREIRLAKILVPIIFVSDHIEYSVDGYEVDALRFLNKNNADFTAKLFECMDKTSYEIENSSQSYYTIKDKGATKSVSFSEVLYFEISNHTISIHTLSGTYSERKKLSELMLELPDQFVRCSRSFIVNVLHIKELTSKNVLLRDGTKLSVTKQHTDDMFKTYIRFH